MTEPVSQAITRRSASNLALAFVLLPRPRRVAMGALYAFCREVDDVADNESKSVAERRRELAAWREDIRVACGQGLPQFGVNRELKPIVARYRLPLDLFEELLSGVEMDLDVRRYATMEDLELYCHRVASVVGLLSIEIFGYRDARCRQYAIELGRALQLTNILRDVRNDADRGRIYLPQTLLREAGVEERDILAHQYSDRYRAAAARVADRARAHYRQAAELLPAEDRRAMIAAELMGSVYWRLLQRLEQRGYDVFGERLVGLSKGHKLGLTLCTWWRLRRGRGTPNYGSEN